MARKAYLYDFSQKRSMLFRWSRKCQYATLSILSHFEHWSYAKWKVFDTLEMSIIISGSQLLHNIPPTVPLV